MITTLCKIWKIADLRKKLIYTFGMLILYRLVGVIPAPGIDAAAVMAAQGGDSLPLLDLVNMMTGGNFSQMTIMAMGITPYINASIIMQLLTIAIPALERLQKEEDGREKIARISRYVTVALAAIQAIGLAGGMSYIKDNAWYNYVLVGVSMAGGTALAMWIGERVTEKGIGNGISLLIFTGIISNLFNGIISNIQTAIVTGTASGWLAALAIIVVAIVLGVLVTFVDLGERRIPIQISKQVKGRRIYGGQSTHMSLKVVSVGVLPLIFAYSFLAFPGSIAQLADPRMEGWFTQWWVINMNPNTFLYMIVSGLLIVAFTFFYSSISFDAKKQAESLVMQGAVIPGQRGKNIRQYLQTTTNRLNLFAALFLAVLAAVPTLLTAGLQASVPFAASSILIAVSVALESIRTIQGEMSVRGIDMDVENVCFM